MEKEDIVQPPPIRYNLKNRERKYRGQERNFNIKKICDNINGGATQERVKKRSMFGYFGHKPRVLSGLDPSESVIIDGIYNEIEPAVLTTKLSCDYDGNIEHTTEFLDNESGRKAARMFANRTGGFSSVIDEKSGEFYGLDWVLDPNFSSNRPYSLDSCGLTFDSTGEVNPEITIKEAITENDSLWLEIIEQKERELKETQAALDSISDENEELIYIIEKNGIPKKQAPYEPNIHIAMDDTNAFNSFVDDFKNAELPEIEEPKKEPEKRTKQDITYDSIKHIMGV